MAYILSAQLDDEETGDTAFARYAAYLDGVRAQLPPGARALVDSGWYFDSSDHRAPHDAWLESVTVSEAPGGEHREARTIDITLKLLGAYHDGRIEFAYRDVTRYRLEVGADDRRPATRGHQDWRYDEFRAVPGGRVEHEIEWWGARPTGTWLIEAADVTYRWLPRADA